MRNTTKISQNIYHKVSKVLMKRMFNMFYHFNRADYFKWKIQSQFRKNYTTMLYEVSFKEKARIPVSFIIFTMFIAVM